MSMDQAAQSAARVSVRNVGGIDEAEVALPSGVSILTGRNATNRTSFLQALMAGLGSEQCSLKGDAEEGKVTLEIENETYTRTLRRRDGTVVFGGDPYLDDPELADLFAFLLEANEARRAVARGENLREVIMRPIDTDRIEAQIAAVQQEREEVEAEIENLDGLERDLPGLTEQRREVRTELESARVELDDLQTELASLDAGIEESRSWKQELETAFQRVRTAQSELEDLEFDLETERSTLEELKAEQKELEATLAEAEDPEMDPERLAGRIEELRRRKRASDETISELGSVISFNQEMLEGDDLDVTEDPDIDTPTDALTADNRRVCWTCGSDVDTEQIERTVDRLRKLRSEKLDERSELQSEIEELTDRQSELESAQQAIARANDRLATVEDNIQTTNERIDDLEARIDAKHTELEELEDKAEAIEADNQAEALELHREINSTELRIERLEDELAEVDEEIADREAAIAERDKLETEREDLSERLADLRACVERTEKEAVAAFNDHMETVLDLLEYDNLDRIWIERRETDAQEGRHVITKTAFDLHVVRTTDEDVVYEDTVDHLSESEREVTGLVFALAGYLVHEVYEDVPFIVLDSLEAIDSDRIARVVEHFRDHADYLVAALLPEDAAALPETFTYVEQID